MTAQAIALGLRTRYPLQAARAKDGTFVSGPGRLGTAALILRNVEMVAESGCWVWMRKLMSNGYAGVRKNSYGQNLAHRASYETFVGPIPNGMFVCHRCDVRSCVNPHHLYVGSHSDNMTDAASKGRMYHGKKTHCPSGHQYSPENTKLRVDKNTGKVVGRLCRTCIIAEGKARWQRNKHKPRTRKNA